MSGKDERRNICRRRNGKVIVMRVPRFDHKFDKLVINNLKIPGVNVAVSGGSCSQLCGVVNQSHKSEEKFYLLSAERKYFKLSLTCCSPFLKW